MQKLENIGHIHKTWTVVHHPPYNLKFPTLWSPLRAINGERLGSDDDVTEKVKKWL